VNTALSKSIAQPIGSVDLFVLLLYFAHSGFQFKVESALTAEAIEGPVCAEDGGPAIGGPVAHRSMPGLWCGAGRNAEGVGCHSAGKCAGSADPANQEVALHSRQIVGLASGGADATGV